MRSWSPVAAIVLALIFAGASHLVADNPDPQPVTPATQEVSAAADSAGASTDTAQGKQPDTVSPSVVAYYFHGNRRCSNCRKLEAYSREAIETGFADELKTGALEFRVINTDEPENKHYIVDYQLYTKSLVISDVVNGEQARWKNLQGVWQYLGDKAAFLKYVETEVRAYLRKS
ncbi:MAG TPA: nitrophenyl compound nitroreductase subunit ArsF family protein [Acidobacteriota bacterium]|nr:nitrophenyl compound nitroreductase subunit ArsF family protein [Acidobacteriota bacterium]